MPRESDRASAEALPPWEQLRSWVAVVETGSVSAAAARLGISQAGVSQHVRQLESLYGTTLLDRSTRPAKATASGLRLLDHATRLLQLGSEMSDSVRSFSRSKRPVVRIGCIDSFAATLGAPLVRALSGRTHKVRLFSGLSPALAAQFADRQLDLLVTTGELADAALVTRRDLLTEQYLVVLPMDVDATRLGSMAELSRRLQFMHYSARSVIGAHIASYLRQTDPGMERAFEFDATDPLLALVADGLGFAITTPLCLWQSRHLATQVQVLPLSVFFSHGRCYPGFSRTLYLASREGELGSLQDEIRSIVDIAARQLVRDVAAQLKLDPGVLRIVP